MLTSLSLPPYNFFIINFFTFPVFFLYLIKKSEIHRNFKYFFLYGWLFGFGYFITNIYWISISLTFDDTFKTLIPLTIILIPAILSLFYGLMSSLFIIFKPKKIISSFLLFSLIFGVLELIRGSILTGFPWNLIVYSLSDQLNFLSIISIIGTYGLNLFCISLFTSPSLLFLRKTKIDIGVCIFLLVSIFVFYIYGSIYKKNFLNADKKIYEYKIRVVGSNISLDRFYLDVDTASIIKDLIQISNPNADKKTIFIWPEGIFPDISKDELIEYSSLFEESFNRNHLLVLGINNNFLKNGFVERFNSLSIYDNNLNLINFYNKNKLVPFGEFLPFEKVLKKIGLKSITNNYNSYTAGNKRNIIEINKQNFSLKILPLICYEIIYSGKLFRNSDFDLIVNISEDGWFGDSIGPSQHFIHSIFRAIESGKYIVRSSNNGIAGIINPLGIVEQRVEFGKTGYIDLVEIRKIQPTIFSKYGNKIFGLLILLYIFLIFSFNKIKNE